MSSLLAASYFVVLVGSGSLYQPTILTPTGPVQYNCTADSTGLYLCNELYDGRSGESTYTEIFSFYSQPQKSQNEIGVPDRLLDERMDERLDFTRQRPLLYDHDEW